ncbi:MAG: antitoxin [Nitrospira bacterium SG8_3]|nr:MAG: antitoxin [Nitrospira bacterium SG8_3]
MKDGREHKGRITIDSQIHFGKPCIAETRIPVENVLELIQEGITFDEIVDKYYPDLEIEDIKACVKYATDLVKQEEVHLSVA